ncbi:ABC transporter permease [Alloacidobacterium dinghuense]|uniref:ABC transporter permease n=1 Tax=Alloacidobacterium dinghuense TaxID=2763107 RepID=A0A7G8BP69_9BACT|nr:ABC transporter permease [Alloacidobacterium dinghuense]QNI34339.1 ABC transporter permease [Alloacidobacterium dinghuense]
MAQLRQDLAYTFRRLSKTPGLVLAVVISIGLGLAANSTIFSMVSRFVLTPPPVGDPGSLLSLKTTDKNECCSNFPWPLYTDLRDQAKSFSGLAAYDELLPASIGGNGEPERLWGQAATANYFDVAQMRMALGRGFLPSEERQQVIVLGYRVWQRRFASDAAIIGKAIPLSGHPYTVVGVAPPGFHGLDSILDPQYWVPLGNIETLAPGSAGSIVSVWQGRDNHWLAVIGRLTAGTTQTQAANELTTLSQSFAKAYPATDKDLGFYTDRAGALPPREKSMTLLFLAALSIVVLLVLAIACANVVNLLLANAAARQREMAVRIALGATRKLLLRQMLLESVILALGGGLVGTGLSLWATSALAVFHIPAPVPIDTNLSIDWRVLLYTFVLSVGTGLFFGLIPALIASRPILTSALKGEDALARPGRRITLRNILVVAQIAMSIILLSATGLFLRSLEHASTIDPGFRSRNVLMVSVDPRVHGYTSEHTAQFLTQSRDRLAAIPGVISAAATDSVPLSGGNRSDGMAAEGNPKQEAPIVEMYMATPGYFETLGIPRIAGRDFANESPTGPKVAVINKALAEKLFPGLNPIGQHVRDGDTLYEVIGVVGNIKSRFIGEDTRPVLFRSLAQSIGSDPSFLGYTLIIHSEGDTANLLSAVRQQIHALDPAMAVYNAETIEGHISSALFLPRLAGTLFGVFGFIGLVLAAVGLYGVMSYAVSRRTREIGIRIALGAQLAAIQRLILRQGMILTLIALVLGLPASLAATKLFNSFLYGVRPHDALTFTLVPVFLATVALVASWIPARRASKVDPQTTLRYE